MSPMPAFVSVSFIEHAFIDASHAAFRDNNIKRDHRRNTVRENDSDSPLFMICVRGKNRHAVAARPSQVRFARHEEQVHTTGHATHTAITERWPASTITRLSTQCSIRVCAYQEEQRGGRH